MAEARVCEERTLESITSKGRYMTLEEARKVADIISTADNGCSHCVSNLQERLKIAFPEFTWTLNFRSDERVEFLLEHERNIEDDYDPRPRRTLIVS